MCIRDSLLYGTGDGKLIFIVTEHSEEIKEKITKDFRRGVSVLNAVSYTHLDVYKRQ